MPFDEVRIYTHAELIRQAEAYLIGRFGRTIPITVDVDLLVEKDELGDLDLWPKLLANHQVEGAVLRDVESGQIFIVVDADLADDETPRGRARYRMVVAEELAHVHLHRKLIEAIKTPDDFAALHRHPKWREIEADAKTFASLVLVPTQRLREEAQDVFAEIVRKPEIRARLDRSAGAFRGFLAPVKKHLCFELSKRFAVEERLMDRRLGAWPADVYKRVDEAMETGLDYLP